MQLTRLICSGFRCLEETDFRPGPGLTVIRGANAQGKTSLLEALLFLATSRSHRTNRETDLVKKGHEAFRLRASVHRRDREVVVEVTWRRGEKRFRINDLPQTRISDVLGKIHVAFFSPEDIELVGGPAARRRRFLDMALAQIDPVYLHALQQYRLALRQRNELLRREQPDSTLLESWDVQLAKHGDRLAKKRSHFVEQLNRYAAKAYDDVAQEERLALAYVPDVELGTSLVEALPAARISDLKQRMTTRGPHRDELGVEIGAKDARHFASQGQHRTAALALRLAELELIRERVGEYPILMLDDALSELDETRARRLFDTIPRDAQCLLTTTDLQDRYRLFGIAATVFRIREGRLEQEKEQFTANPAFSKGSETGPRKRADTGR